MDPLPGDPGVRQRRAVPEAQGPLRPERPARLRHDVERVAPVLRRRESLTRIGRARHLAERVRNPPGEPARGFPEEEVEPVRRAARRAELVTDEGGVLLRVAVHQVVHPLPVALDGERSAFAEPALEPHDGVVGRADGHARVGSDPELEQGDGDLLVAQRVDVLVVPPARDAERRLAVQERLGREARRDTRERRARQRRHAHPRPEQQPRQRPPLILGVRLQRRRAVGQPGEIDAHFARAGEVADVVPLEHVAGGGDVPPAVPLHVAREREPAHVVGEREQPGSHVDVGEEGAVAGPLRDERPRAHRPAPRGAEGAVAPVEAEGLLGLPAVGLGENEVEVVPAREARSRQRTAQDARQGHATDEVLEVVRKGRAAERCDELVGVGAPPRNQPAAAPARERPLEVELGGEHRYRRGAVQPRRSAGPLVHLEHAREPAAVARREAARQEVEPLDRVVREGRDDAAEVERVEHDLPVEQDEVLVRVAAPDVEPHRVVVARHDPGEQLHGAQQVRLGQSGHARDLPDPEGARGRLDLVLEPRPLGGAGYRRDASHGDGLGLEPYRDAGRGALAHGDRDGGGPVTDASHLEAPRPGRHVREGEGTAGVAEHPHAEAQEGYRRRAEGLVGRGSDRAPQTPRLRREGTCQQQRGRREGRQHAPWRHAAQRPRFHG